MCLIQTHSEGSPMPSITLNFEGCLKKWLSWRASSCHRDCWQVRHIHDNHLQELETERWWLRLRTNFWAKERNSLHLESLGCWDCLWLPYRLPRDSSYGGTYLNFTIFFFSSVWEIPVLTAFSFGALNTTTGHSYLCTALHFPPFLFWRLNCSYHCHITAQVAYQLFISSFSVDPTYSSPLISANFFTRKQRSWEKL